MVICDGVAFYTVGLSTGTAGSSFDYTAINVAGTGNYTLSGSELNRIAYNFTGVLTGNRSIIVPVTVQQYWVTNSTTGAFTLTVKTSAGTGIAVAQGDAQILYCDGTNVVKGQTTTGGITVPVAIADGGTGATTASGARINLGGTSVGIGVFTAATTSAGQTALGATATGQAVFIAANAAAGRTALGATAVGDAVFIAANAAAARTAIDAPSKAFAVAMGIGILS
jgi:hypothetical protein